MTKFESVIEFLDLLKLNEVRVWVFGGYAIEALRGVITREHGDVDMYVLLDDWELFREACTRAGLEIVQRKNMYFIDTDELHVGIVILDMNGDSVVARGNKFIEQFPRSMWHNDTLIELEGYRFRIAPIESIRRAQLEFGKYQADIDEVLKHPIHDDWYNQIELIPVER